MAEYPCFKISEITDGRRWTVQSSSAPAIDVGVVNDTAENNFEMPLSALMPLLHDHPNHYLRYSYDGNDNYCAYRIDIKPKTKFEVMNKSDIDGDAYGLKTNFAINEWTAGPFDLVILDNGMVLTSNVLDSDYSWYTAEAGHFAAILGYYDLIQRRVWQTSLLYFVPELYKSILDMTIGTGPQDQESDEALIEIATFMDWLYQYSPVLYDKVAFRIDQSTEGHDNMTFCELNFFSDAYAFAYDGNITILPAGISALKNGEYEFMALVMEHELTHNLIRESGLITPSEQLFVKGLLSYIAKNRLYNVPGLSAYLGRHAPCQIQPFLLLEEEIVATYSEVLSPNVMFSYELADSYSALDELESRIYTPDIYPPEMLDIHHHFVKNALEILDMQK